MRRASLDIELSLLETTYARIAEPNNMYESSCRSHCRAEQHVRIVVWRERFMSGESSSVYRTKEFRFRVRMDEVVAVLRCRSSTSAWMVAWIPS